jgi:hypothetical protein
VAVPYDSGALCYGSDVQLQQDRTGRGAPNRKQFFNDLDTSHVAPIVRLHYDLWRVPVAKSEAHSLNI